MVLIFTMMFTGCAMLDGILRIVPARDPSIPDSAALSAAQIASMVMAGTVTLTADQFVMSSLNNDIQSRTFLFPVVEGTEYHVWLYDFDALNTLVDGIMAARSSDGTVIFPNTDIAWNNPRQFTADRNGTVLITVVPHNVDCPFYRSGLFAIVFNTTGTRPDPPNMETETVRMDGS